MTTDEIRSAIDDLVDIYGELNETQSRWQHNSQADALWYFEWSYRSHWGEHLRGLQLYLHALSQNE